MSFSSFCVFCSGANLRLNFDISCVRSWKISCMQKHHQSPINTGILAILSPLVPLEKFVLIARKLHVFFLIFGDFASFSSSILFLDSRPSTSSLSLSLNQNPDFRRATSRSAKHMSKLCVLLSLNQHLFTILDIDSLLRSMFQLAA